MIPHTFGEQETFVKDVICASACAFAFVGGVNRSIADGSRYGIRQFFGESGNIGDSATQLTVVALALYLEQMGIDRGLLNAASLVPHQEMYWISLSDLNLLQVDNMMAAYSRWQLSPLSDGNVAANFEQFIPEFRSRVSLILVKLLGRPSLVINFTPGERYSGSPVEASEVLNSEGSVVLKIDGHQVAKYKSVKWKHSTKTVATALPLSDSVIHSLGMGGRLEVDVWVANAFHTIIHR